MRRSDVMPGNRVMLNYDGHAYNGCSGTIVDISNHGYPEEMFFVQFDGSEYLSRWYSNWLFELIEKIPDGTEP